MVRWRLARKRIELTPDLNNRDEMLYISFGEGTQHDERVCIQNLARFIQHYGIQAQWTEDGIDMFNRRLWRAARICWGLPRWEDPHNLGQ